MQHWIAPPADAVAPLLDFAPVPRKYRYDGWTAERQRAFIAALAETGSVTAAAKRINMSPEGAYYLRRQPGADGFRAAWAAALAHGVQRLTDIAIERAIEGVPVPVFHKGEQVGEKRWFNDRLLMFIMRHHLPALYGARPLHPGTRHPETVAREAAENCPVCKERREQDTQKQAKATARWYEDVFHRYRLKLRAERRDRLAGRTVAADFTLRQLTHIELILDVGGHAMKMIDLATRPEDPDTELFEAPVSAELDRLRRATWAEAGEPDRPPRSASQHRDTSSSGGPTGREREHARRHAERRIAEAQAEWDAAGDEGSWQAWKASRGALGEG